MASRKQRATRREVLERDNYECQSCGNYSTLEVHHIVPRSAFGKNNRAKRDQARNLITLCAQCHRLDNKGAGSHTTRRKESLLAQMSKQHGYTYKDWPFSQYWEEQ